MEGEEANKTPSRGRGCYTHLMSRDGRYSCGTHVCTTAMPSLPSLAGGGAPLLRRLVWLRHLSPPPSPGVVADAQNLPPAATTTATARTPSSPTPPRLPLCLPPCSRQPCQPGGTSLHLQAPCKVARPPPLSPPPPTPGPHPRCHLSCLRPHSPAPQSPPHPTARWALLLKHPAALGCQAPDLSLLAHQHRHSTASRARMHFLTDWLCRAEAGARASHSTSAPRPSSPAALRSSARPGPSCACCQCQAAPSLCAAPAPAKGPKAQRCKDMHWHTCPSYHPCTCPGAASCRHWPSLAAALPSLDPLPLLLYRLLLLLYGLPPLVHQLFVQHDLEVLKHLVAVVLHALTPLGLPLTECPAVPRRRQPLVPRERQEAAPHTARGKLLGRTDPRVTRAACRRKGGRSRQISRAGSFTKQDPAKPNKRKARALPSLPSPPPASPGWHSTRRRQSVHRTVCPSELNSHPTSPPPCPRAAQVTAR